MAKLNEISNLLNNLKIDLENLYYDLLLDTMANIVPKVTLEDCILQSNSSVKENLAKIYGIKNLNEQQFIPKLLKLHNSENIKKLFCVFQDKEKETLNDIITKQEDKINNKNMILITKLCSLGLCFKTNINGTKKYYIPTEITDIWNDNISEFGIIDDAKKIIKMCGVIKLQELYKMYINTYNSNIDLKDFKFYLDALCAINIRISSNNDVYHKIELLEENIDKYLEIQESNECKLEGFYDKVIIDLYVEGMEPCSPFAEELLGYLQNFNAELDRELIISITQTLREQLEFDANELMKEINNYVKISSNDTRHIVLQLLIRMYHDTRLYKFRGFKPFEIGEYLTDTEIEKIENDFEIKFENIGFLRLEDLYPENLYEALGVPQKEEDGVISHNKTVYLTQYEIKKNKKFATYLYETEHIKLENIYEIYCTSNLLSRPSVHKEEIIDFIEENTEEILEYNYASLRKDEFIFLNEVIKNNGYIELTNDDSTDFESIYELIRRGFIFTGVKEIKDPKLLQVHIPNDTLELIKDMFNKYHPKQILDLRILLSGIANAYGVITKTQARYIVSKVKSNLLKTFDKFSNIIDYTDSENYSYNMSITNIVDGETMILAKDFLSTETMKELLNINMEYKLYSYNDYIKLGTFDYKSHLHEYKELENYLREHFDITCMCSVNDIIDGYYFIQQVNKDRAEIHLNNNLQKLFIIDVEERIAIYNLLKSMIINISNKMPQWKLKGNIEERIIVHEFDKSGQDPKIGRNDPCSCGSGKKYKKCHGK